MSNNSFVTSENSISLSTCLLEEDSLFEIAEEEEVSVLNVLYATFHCNP